MTVIVWDGVSLVADKQATDGGMTRTVTKVKKITKGKFKGYLMGGSGPCSSANAVMLWFERGADEKDFPKHQDDEELGAVLTVISPTKQILRYEYSHVPIVFEDKWYCTGSGREFAYGALAMGADARRAAAVACEFSAECGMGLDEVFLVEPKRKRK